MKYLMHIYLKQYKNQITFNFTFSEGNKLRSQEILQVFLRR